MARHRMLPALFLACGCILPDAALAAASAAVADAGSALRGSEKSLEDLPGRLMSKFVPALAGSVPVEAQTPEVQFPSSAVPPACLLNSGACQSESELRAWFSSVLEQLDRVPDAVPNVPKQAAETEFQKRRAELKATANQERDELRQWRDSELGRIERVPRIAQAVARDLLDKEFQRRVLAASSGHPAAAPGSGSSSLTAGGGRAAVPQVDPPQCLLDASACASERELRAWRVTKLTWIRDQVPPEQQREEVLKVRADYEQRRSELLRSSQHTSGASSATEEVTPAPPPVVAALVAATEASAPEGDAGRLLRTFGLCALGLAAPAFFAAFLGACAEARRRSSDACSPSSAVVSGYLPMEQEM